MPTFDIYSKRQKKLRGDVPDVFIYDDLPNGLRVQIIHIVSDTIGMAQHYCDSNMYDYVLLNKPCRDIYKSIVEILCREYGVFHLNSDQSNRNGYGEELFRFLIEQQDVEKVIDAIEVVFQCVGIIYAQLDILNRSHRAFKQVEDAIEELNERFLESGVGFRYADGKIIRIDSEFIHTEVVKRALMLLHQKQYAGAQEEFLKAHEHYRNGDFKEALEECLKSFESLMKSICAKNKWPYSDKDTAKQLIDICFQNRLVPEFWQCHYSALRSMLESGIPTGRNKLAAHGQGEEITVVPRHIVAYMLHMTASTIVFLAEAESNKP